MLRLWPVNGLASFGEEEGSGACDAIWDLIGEVGHFPGVLFEVVELDFSGACFGFGGEGWAGEGGSAERLPATLHEDGLIEGAFEEFPIEHWVAGLFLFPSAQGGHEADGIEAGGRVETGEGGGGGQKVGGGGDALADGSGGDAAGPAGQQGDADSAFCQVAFSTAERAAGEEEGGIVSGLEVGAIV